MILQFLMFAFLAFSIPAFAAPPSDWKIDKRLKFHIAYLPSMQTSGTANEILIPALNHIPVFQPDITNIQYSVITSLGFPLPARENAEKLTLYLKLYQWPKGFDANVSSRRILDPFLLSQVPGGRELERYVSDRKNVLLKFASIDNSSREFSIRNALTAPLPKTQAEFDSSIPFSSIYVQLARTVRASSETEQVDISANGVRSIHKSLLNLYEKVFQDFGQDEKSLYFVEAKRCPSNPAQICGARIFSFPKAPLVFKNYKDLPMPQDPKNIFLSGLLLIKLTDYAAATSVTEKSFSLMVANQENFLTAFKPTWAHMLEVGSVFNRKLVRRKTK